MGLSDARLLRPNRLRAVESDLAAALDAQLASKDPGCAGTFKTATVAGTGKVTCSGGTATYDATLEEISTLSYSPACFSAASGGAALNASPCTQIRSNMNDTADTQGSCCYNGTSCNCTMTTTHVNRDVNTLSISGSTISESDGTSYEFCINGSSMSQRESMGGSAYVVTGLTKR